MRLDRVYIDGFKNLKEVEADFDESRLTSVIIGVNGAGKSNLIEAIVDVFRFADINRGAPRYTYEIDYRIGNHKVRLSNRKSKPSIEVDGKSMARSTFDREKAEVFPDLVFGYYSGGSRRLEQLFDSHQRRYYDAIKTNDDLEDCRRALADRRLFYCRPIHGIFALFSLFAFPDSNVHRLLREKLGITGFHSALAHFKAPWFAKGARSIKLQDAADLWDAKGPAGSCARYFRDEAFHPMRLVGNAIDDYRDKQQNEAQFACFLKDEDGLGRFKSIYADDQELFAALEAVDISDLFRDLHLWVRRANDNSGDVSFADLSDGERQLLMVLGLIRVSRGKRALFMLDEPDTHLNPVWQHTYLDLIREWTGQTADAKNCHIIMSSHNPLTIAALDRREVRVMFTDVKGKVSVTPPYTDPKGMGFTATLTEIFGLPSSLDSETQRQVDERNNLARLERRSEAQEKHLIEINDKLGRLGFMFEDREPLYQDFLRAWQDVKYADRPPMSPEQIEKRHNAMKALIKDLLTKREGAT
ncbi:MULTISPECIES: ATP-binding protein [Bradyrhizobium]|uniref:AAA family ATPase n=1 Tax=Bradyrhizobium TaxID=374 RepID=UPI0004AE3733|nr:MULTISPECIES: ATP-binding protein [Bradyrhizobium]MDI2076693.1 AAA family ATPase [Bradyrhizobium sp. Mp27]